MAINVGDKVRFLDAMGGGVVSKIVDKDTVLVTDEDGFDFPTLVKDCVVVGNTADEDRFKVPENKAAAKKEAKKEPAKPVFVPKKKITQIEEFDAVDVPDKSLIQPETKEGEKLNVSLAFVPIDIKQLSTTSYDFYLINDSNYELAYTVAAGVGNTGFRHAAGFIQANTKIFIEELAKHQLNDIEHLTVQFIAFKKDKDYSIKPAVSSQLRVNPVKFCKLHCFGPNDYFDEDAMIVPVVKDDQLQQLKEVSAQDIATAMQTKEVSADKPHLSKSSKPSKEPLVIDLHINELLDNTAGMEAKDMLEYQMNKFHEVMKENLNFKGKKIIFIHGKGDGVLRRSILNALRSKYARCQAQDASFQEYGFGATQVTIH